MTNCLRKNSWIQTFTKGNSTMWNVNSFIQDLYSSNWVYNLWWSPHHERPLLVIIYIFTSLLLLWPSQLGLQNTLTASLQRGKTPPNKCSGYDTVQSDGEAPVMLDLWGMWSIFSLPLLSGLIRPGVVAPDRVLSLGQIKLNCLFKLNWIV